MRWVCAAVQRKYGKGDTAAAACYGWVVGLLHHGPPKLSKRASCGIVQVTAEDRQALVTRVFAAYLTLMRKVQTTYWCARPFMNQILMSVT